MMAFFFILVNKEKTVKYFKIPQVNILGVNFPIEKEKTHNESVSRQDDLQSNTEVTATNAYTETEGGSCHLDNPVLQTNKVSENPNTEKQTRQELQSSLNLGKTEQRKMPMKTPSKYSLKSLLQTFDNVTFHGERSVQYLTLLDFAGQSAYYACHQIYLSERAFYILVMDMSKDLNAVVGEEVCDHSHTVFETWRYRGIYYDSI
ncbi:hypothetical protein MHBO_002652 [Bonamia ostreae]|uniref:Uncharacterized protein n=1 Tax=Bonamia ostreae TaxID=126728 RepID=A0ABV2ANH3_9EUKA